LCLFVLFVAILFPNKFAPRFDIKILRGQY